MLVACGKNGARVLQSHQQQKQINVQASEPMSPWQCMGDILLGYSL